MCGRGAVFFPRRSLATLTQSSEDRWVDAELYQPTYNAGPGSYLPVLVHDINGQPHLHTMKWGLIPSFQKPSDVPDHFRMFNARSETVHEKNAFKRLLKRKRCVACFNGFYEWEKIPGSNKKQPFFIRREEGKPLFFAGLFDVWKTADQEELHSFTIITADSAKSQIRWLHDRIPIILDSDAKIASWLSSSSDGDGECGLSKTYSGPLQFHMVSPEVGKLSFNRPECIDMQSAMDCERNKVGDTSKVHTLNHEQYVPPKPKREGADIVKLFQKKMKKEHNVKPEEEEEKQGNASHDNVVVKNEQDS